MATRHELSIIREKAVWFLAPETEPGSSSSLGRRPTENLDKALPFWEVSMTITALGCTGRDQPGKNW